MDQSMKVVCLFNDGGVYHYNREVPGMNQSMLIIYSLSVLIWQFLGLISIRRSVVHKE